MVVIEPVCGLKWMRLSLGIVMSVPSVGYSQGVGGHCPWQFDISTQNRPSIADLVEISDYSFPSLEQVRAEANPVLRGQLARNWIQDFYAFIDGLFPTLPTVQQDIQATLGIAMAHQTSFRAIEMHALQLQLYLPGSVLSKDPVAVGNALHVRELLGNLELFSKSIRSQWVEPYLGRTLSNKEWAAIYQFLRTTIAVHDLGKTWPHPIVTELVDYLPFPSTTKEGLRQRISLHTISDYSTILEIAALNEVPSIVVRLLLKTILGHNDGSGLHDVFWNMIAHPPSVTGPDRVPEVFFGNLLAFLDRAGQANLGPSGGVRKILNQRWADSQTWNRALLVNVVESNATDTLRQMKSIAARVSAKNPGAPPVENSEVYLELMGLQRRSLELFRSIQWTSETNGKGVFEGKNFSFDSKIGFEELLVKL